MECPLVFGFTEELEQAGIQTGEMYGSLEEFLDALLKAQEKTGKQVFEDDAAVDWLEQYYMPDDKAQAETLKGKLEQLRARCGNGEGYLDAYRGLDGGRCLLGGSGIYDYKQLAANLSLFGESRPVTLLGVPCSGGGMKGIITHAAAVNAASKHAEKAAAALLGVFKNWALPWASDIPVQADSLEGLLDCHTAEFQEIESVRALYDGCRIPGKVDRAFREHVRKGIGSIAYVQEFGGRHEDVEKTGERTKVVSISCPDYGRDPDDPVANWLEAAAAAYMQEHSDTYIQLVQQYRWRELCQYGVATDAVIGAFKLTEEDAGRMGDFSALEGGGSTALDALPEILKGGIDSGGKTVGLPVWAEEYGIWCSRKALDAAGLTENWRPKDAGEMAGGLRKLKQALELAADAPAAVVDYDYDAFLAMALFLSEPQAGLLERQEDGSFLCSKAGWASYLSCLQEWVREGLAAHSGSDIMQGRQALDLAEGRLGAWIGDSSMSGWFDGTYGLQLSKGQQEDILFIPLSPAANMAVVSVSGTSEYAEDVFAFWEEAVQNPGYAQAVRESCHIPVTELSKTVCQTLPLQMEKCPLDRMVYEEVWNLDKTAEELAEEYPWYEWTEE